MVFFTLCLTLWELPKKSCGGLFFLLKCPVLACLDSNLNYPIYLLPLGFYLFLFLFVFSFLFILCLALWLGSWPLFFSLLDFFFLQISPPIHSLCLSAPPVLSPALLLTVQLVIRAIRSFSQAKNHSFTELNKWNIKECCTSLHHQKNVPQYKQM